MKARFAPFVFLAMGRYDKYKRLYFSNNIVKGERTTTTNSFGVRSTAGGGNEAIEMVEWINERVDSGDILFTGVGGTDLTNGINGGNKSVIYSSTGNPAILLTATSTYDGVMSKEDKIKLDSLVTLTGVAANSLHLGTFTGTTIPNNVTIKQALQSLETSLESNITSFGDLTSSSLPITITNGLGSVKGTGTAISLNPALIQLSTLGGTLPLNKLSTASATTGQVIAFNGTTYAPTTLTTSLPLSPVDGDLIMFDGSSYVTISPRKEVFFLSSGNSFNITYVPKALTFVDVYYNGLYQIQDHDFTIVGTLITFSLLNFKTNDQIVVKYYK